MKHTLAIALVLACTGTANASEWTYADVIDGLIWEYKPSHRVEYIEHTPYVYQWQKVTDTNDMTVAFVLMEVDCKAKVERYKTSVTYKDGKVFKFEPFNSDRRWYPMVPGTIGEYLIEKACEVI